MGSATSFSSQFRLLLFLTLFGGNLFLKALGQTWCNKNYMITQPIVPPGGQFPVPATSSTPLLALRCGQAVKPFLPEDVLSGPSVLVSTPVMFSEIANAAPLHGLPSSISSASATLKIDISVDSKTLGSGTVPLNSTKYAIPISLQALPPREEPYVLTCKASFGTQEFVATSFLSFLPTPSGSSVTKMDMKTGALLAKPATGEAGPYKKVFPIGFYTNWSGYLALNLSKIAELKEQGFTVIHPVTGVADLSTDIFNEAVAEMQKQGMYLMYDMRGSYLNTTSIPAQISALKSKPNLLLWYTADEPDGTSDPLNATVNAYEIIANVDGGVVYTSSNGIQSPSSLTPLTGGYHPASLVLNCENYQFTAYSSGADIILQDTYMIGNNVTFSSQWGTPCTPDFGDCGCDNCIGSFTDISTRMDEFKERIFVNGWELSKAVWTVPQGFGNETYWTRYPTGKEWVVESVVGINHGALGVISWIDPTPDDIKSAASTLALALAKDMTAFILDDTVTFRGLVVPDPDGIGAGVDLGIWTVPQPDGKTKTLVLGTNMGYGEAGVTVNFSQLFDSSQSSVIGNGAVSVMELGANLTPNGRGMWFGPTGSGAFVV